MQPHGVVLVVAEDGRIECASESASSLLDRNPRSLLGETLDSVLSQRACHAIRSAVERGVPPEASPLRVQALNRKDVFDAILHRQGERLVVELEPQPRPIPIQRSLHRQLQSALTRLHANIPLPDLCRVAASDLQNLTGFGRVLIGRTVEGLDVVDIVAEAVADGGAPAFLGAQIRAPEDVVPPAPRQGEPNRSLIVPDLDYQAASLVGDVHVDLEDCCLTGLSEATANVHRKLGASACMTIPLAWGDTTWGLVVCHHHAPHHVPYETRVACEFLGQALSWQIGARAQKERDEQERVMRECLSQLVERLGHHVDPQESILANAPLSMELTGATGFASWRHGHVELVGTTPTAHETSALARWLHDGGVEDCFATIHAREVLGDRHPACAAGILAVALEPTEGAYLMWFRPERVDEVRWIATAAADNSEREDGEAETHGLRQPEGKRDSERRFRVERVRGRSEPWTDAQVHGARMLRDAVGRLALQRTTDLIHLNRGLAEASRAKDEFIAAVSHELRTPLNAIMGWTELARAPGAPPDAATRALEVVERHGAALARLVDDLIDLSLIDAGEIRLTPQIFPVTEAIRRAVSSLASTARARDVRLQVSDVPEDLVVRGDLDRLSQVVWNLVSNGVKFTPRGGRVVVTASRTGPDVEIVVQDDGIGISEAVLPTIFARFRRSDATEDGGSGLGLGLAVASELIKLHGGTVQAESKGQGTGATFRVVLPTPDAEREVFAATPPPPSAARSDGIDGVRVLVVEDDVDALELLSRMLERQGANVSSASSAEQALAALETHTFDVLLSDIGLPALNGYDLIRRIRQLPESHGGSLPAIAITAYGSGADRARAFRSGFQAHLTKPFNPEELFSLVTTLSETNGTGTD
jgi:light-regulated signal transduction histidine kinase (bacteriophytochrome)/ActR/RegA family two-component response regulator